MLAFFVFLVELFNDRNGGGRVAKSYPRNVFITPPNPSLSRDHMKTSPVSRFPIGYINTRRANNGVSSSPPNTRDFSLQPSPNVGRLFKPFIFDKKIGELGWKSITISHTFTQIPGHLLSQEFTPSPPCTDFLRFIS